MKDKEIVIFSSDDWGWKTSKYQLSTRFARNNKVLFVSSIGFRKPTKSRQDLGRILAKLKSFFRGIRKVDKNLYVMTPLIVPFGWFPCRAGFNRMILRAQLRVVMSILRMRTPVLFVFSQNWYPYVSSIPNSSLVYYKVDEHSSFDGLDKQLFIDLDRKMARAADKIICSSRTLYEASLPLNSETHYVPHGVDYQLFSSTLDHETPRAGDLSHIRYPVFMFIGHISYDWMDAELVKFVAGSRADWNIVLVGRYSMDADEFDGYGNIVLAGEKPYERLPEYCKAADVGIIPFVDSELTRNCNPLKLPEYIAAGLPVVSTRIPEVVRSYSEYAYIGHDYDSFLEACDRALRENDSSTNLQRSKAMEQSSWDRRVDGIFHLLEHSPEEGGLSPSGN